MTADPVTSVDRRFERSSNSLLDEEPPLQDPERTETSKQNLSNELRDHSAIDIRSWSKNLSCERRAWCWSAVRQLDL